jgi:hypothetical protein
MAAIPLAQCRFFFLLGDAPAGLSPAEHTSFYWTHFRTAGFPRYGWKAGLSGGAFPVRSSA